MRRNLAFLTMGLTLLAAQPAFATEYEDALECSAFMGIAYLEVAEAQRTVVNDLKNGWKDHARRIAPDQSDVDADVDAQRRALYSFAATTAGKDRQAKYAALGQRCQTVPDIRAYTYRDEVCGRFANAMWDLSKKDTKFFTDYAKPGGAQGSAEEIERRRQNSVQEEARAHSILKAYNDKHSAYPRPNDFKTFGLESDAMLDSCARSLGVN